MVRRASTKGFYVGYRTGLGCGDSRAVTKLLNCGVKHRDVRPPNVLWNPEARNVVMVDFECSEILTGSARDIAQPEAEAPPHRPQGILSNSP
jgi:serine/threonine protein kinase